PPPVPAEVSDVEVGEVDDVGAAEHEGGEQREEEGGLLDEVAVAPNDARDERGESAVARQVPSCSRVDAGYCAPRKDGERDPRVGAKCIGALQRERLEPSA